MIIYRSTKAEFVERAIGQGNIADAVRNEYEKRIGKVNDNEYRSWKNSLRAMGNVVDDQAISDDATVCIEYKLQNRGSRIDFLIAGKDQSGKENVVIVELKQWDAAKAVDGKELVSTYVGGDVREVVHPSYQAWSYAVTLSEYNETVQNDDILLFPCAFLHNYSPLKNDSLLDSRRFREIEEAPVFIRSDDLNLRRFIVDHVSGPDTNDIMSRIDSGRIKPSKSLQDVLGSMLDGNREFVLIDDQKKVYENIMHDIYRLKPEDNRKHVYIIEGGPGTGKSVIAVNLLAQIVRDGKAAAYVTKNAAPRNVYEYKLARNGYRKNYIHSLFLSSGNFIDMPCNEYDALIVDEAHRLNAKSGMFANKGENQIKEIINAAKVSVFFIDENQKVTAKDIGSVEMIENYAKEVEATIYKLELTSQFRCNGSDGYLNFLDDVLDIQHSYYTFDESDYDIRVVDDPNAMMDEISRRNMVDNKARMLAGYCWNWESKKHADAYDIVLPDCDFQAQWNYNNTTTWAIDDDTINQIGCIHTSQGLEFSYVGVIIGNDLRYENGRVITDYTQRAKTDASLNGLKTLCDKGDPIALKRADLIIRDTYKTLLSRAMKGCLVYCTDKGLADHIRAKIAENRRLYDEFNDEVMMVAEKF